MRVTQYSDVSWKPRPQAWCRQRRRRDTGSVVAGAPEVKRQPPLLGVTLWAALFGAGKRAQKGDQEGRAGQNRRLGRCPAGGRSRARRASGGARRPPGAVVIQGRVRWVPPSLEPQRSGGASGARWRAPGGVGVGSPARVPSREAGHRRCRLGRRRELRGNAFVREAAPRREDRASRPLFSGRAPSGRPGFLGREVSAVGSVGSGCRGSGQGPGSEPRDAGARARGHGTDWPRRETGVRVAQRAV